MLQKNEAGCQGDVLGRRFLPLLFKAGLQPLSKK